MFGEELKCSPEQGYYLVTSNCGNYEFKVDYNGLLAKFNNDATINYVMSGRDKYWSITKINSDIDKQDNTFILY